MIKVYTQNALEIMFVGDGDQVLKKVESSAGSYFIYGDEGYIRVEAAGASGSKAWTQPLFWDKEYVRPIEPDTTDTLGSGGEPTGIYTENTHLPTIYPNPANKFMIMECPVNIADANLKLIDSKGAIVLNRSLKTYDKVELSGYSRGVYVVKIESPDLNWIQKVLVH